MVSKTLIRLIDFSIFPAVLIIGAKVVGIAFLLRYFQVDYSVEGLQIVIKNSEDLMAVHSYSSLFMLAAIVAGLAWVIVKAHVFHDTHISPSLSSRLFGMNLEELIHNTTTIYTQTFIWLSYSWLATVILAVTAFYGLAYWWVFFVGLIVSIISSAFVVMDIEREINASKSLLREESEMPLLSFDKLKKEFAK